MDSYSRKDTLDKLAASNWGHNNRNFGKSYSSSSVLDAARRRSSGDTKPEMLHHQDFVSTLERKPEIETLKHIHQNEDGLSEDNMDAQSIPPEDEEVLNLEFEACIQEHQDTRMKIFPKLFKCLKHSHFYTQLVVYYISVLVIGVPATLLWGCLSGATVFARVWIWVPILKLILFWLHSCAPALLRPAQVLCIPCIDICARRYRQIRIQTKLSGISELPVMVKNV